MPGNFDFSVIISQVPRVQKLQGDMQHKPLVVQEGLQREVDKKQEQEKTEIQNTSESSSSNIVQKEKEKEKEEQRRQKKRKKDRDEERKIAEEERGKFIDLEV